MLLCLQPSFHCPPPASSSILDSPGVVPLCDFCLAHCYLWNKCRKYLIKVLRVKRTSGLAFLDCLVLPGSGEFKYTWTKKRYKVKTKEGMTLLWSVSLCSPLGWVGVSGTRRTLMWSCGGRVTCLVRGQWGEAHVIMGPPVQWAQVTIPHHKVCPSAHFHFPLSSCHWLLQRPAFSTGIQEQVLLSAPSEEEAPMQELMSQSCKLHPTTEQSSVYLQLQVFPEGKPDVLRTFPWRRMKETE